ncbi:MAG: glycosyltransferase family 39 protein [Thermoanaerobaculia bacterium]
MRPALPNERSSGRHRLADWLLPAATLAFYLATTAGYGIFRDELYYLACSRHLDWGYVDHPPLIAWLTAFARAVFGESLFALRLLPAVAAAATVWVAQRVATTLGGTSFAAVLAGLATALAPIYLSLFSILSMNAFDVLIWATLWWLAARLLAGDEPRLWLAFGAVAGFGLQNKISVLFLGFGLLVGLVVTRRWEVLRERRLWLGGALAFLLFSPHLIWQFVHDWPTLEFMENAQRFKITDLSPAAFIAESALQAGPGSLLIWVGGMLFLLSVGAARPWRALGWAHLAILALMVGSNAKPYYLAPSYLMLFSAGAVAIERWSAGRARPLRWVAAGLVIVSGIVTAPLAKPLLSEDAYVRYAARLGFAPGTDENHELGRLPQFFADMHGWEELARTVADVYHVLPEADRSRACVFGQNYGQAGAIEYFGLELGLPPALAGHNSYHLWGPGACTGEVVIVIDDDRESMEATFESAELATTFTCIDCMPYESHKQIWVGRRLRLPIAELWPQAKHFD